MSLSKILQDTSIANCNRVTCCNHDYCLTCALREIRDGKPCKVCGKALYLFLVQGNTPISKALHHLYTARQRDASWNLVVFCLLAIIVVDLVSLKVLIPINWLINPRIFM